MSNADFVTALKARVKSECAEIGGKDALRALGSYFANAAAGEPSVQGPRIDVFDAYRRIQDAAHAHAFADTKKPRPECRAAYCAILGELAEFAKQAATA